VEQPQPGGASATRDTILDAAERLFAARGFDAATVKELGAEAGVNPALIYYYFENKQGLHHAVLDRFAGELIGRARVALEQARTPDDVIRAVVRTQSQMLSGYPRRARILARELVEHEGEHVESFINRIAADVFERLRGAIAQGQQSGRFRRDVDPAYAAISTISQVVYFHLARPIVRVLLRERGTISWDEEHAFAEHAARFALAALTRDEA